MKKPGEIQHKTLLRTLQANPDLVERGFRIIDIEFGLGHIRMNIVGKDSRNTLCIVELKLRKEDDENGKQKD